MLVLSGSPISLECPCKILLNTFAADNKVSSSTNVTVKFYGLGVKSVDQ